MGNVPQVRRVELIGAQNHLKERQKWPKNTKNDRGASYSEMAHSQSFAHRLPRGPSVMEVSDTGGAASVGGVIKR